MLSFISKNFDSFFILVRYFCIIYFGSNAVIWAIEKLSSFIRRKKNEKRISIYNQIILSLSPRMGVLREKDFDIIFNDVACHMGVTERKIEKALKFLENEHIVEKTELKGMLCGIKPMFSYRLTKWFVAIEFPTYIKYKTFKERCKTMTLKELISD